MKTTAKVVMHYTAEEKPTKTTDVLCITKYNSLVNTNYSYKWDAFNYFDYMEKPSADHVEEWEDYVVYWAYAEDLKAQVVYETE